MSPENLRLLKIVAFMAAGAWAFHRMAGKLSAKMFFAPLVFLISRRAVLIAWLIGSVGMFWLITESAAANGKSPDPWGVLGLSLFCGLGFAPLTVGPLFFIARLFAPVPTLELEDGEEVVAKHKANHMLGLESRGGELALTDRALRFVPHRFNVQLDTWRLPYEAARRVAVSGTRLVVIETPQADELLVVPQPGNLADAIRARAGLGAEG